MEAYTFEALMPTDPKIMGKQLTGRHRNCREIYELSRHISAKASSGYGDDMHLRESNDPIKDIPLPEGSVPLWIVREKDGCDMGKLIRVIEDDYIKRGANVTVVSRVSYLTTGLGESVCPRFPLSWIPTHFWRRG